jgi:hypothetical protein
MERKVIFAGLSVTVTARIASAFNYASARLSIHRRTSFVTNPFALSAIVSPESLLVDPLALHQFS